MSESSSSFIIAIVLIGSITLIIVSIALVSRRRKLAQQKQLEDWATASGYGLLPRINKKVDPASYSGLGFSSFKDGVVNVGFTGILNESQNAFAAYLQTEIRGSGKNRRVYERTIIEVDIPDTQLQMIINSKINDDNMSGGNLGNYSTKQRFSLEGDFGQFFEVYMPNQTQSETLTLLAPNSMLFILKELAGYDMEINGSKLFIYTYRHFKQEDMYALIPRLDVLMKELRLRRNDVRLEKITNAEVARTAADASTVHRGLKKDTKYLAIIFAVFVVLGQEPAILP